MIFFVLIFFFSSRRRHTRYIGDWSSDVCSSDLASNHDSRRPPRSPRSGFARRPRPRRDRREIGRDTSELQSPMYLVCRLLLEKKNKQKITTTRRIHTRPFCTSKYNTIT